MPAAPSPRRGPDLVIAGAARSATSHLAARLAAHPRVDAGSVKESNYYSRHLDRGPDWYDRLYERPGDDPAQLRMDASVSYTYPAHAGALPLLVHDAPGAFVIYVVRDPVARAASHYLYNRHYFRHDTPPTFGAALDEDELYAGVGAYPRWLGLLDDLVPVERRLLVPFERVRSDVAAVAHTVCAQLDLDDPPEPDGRADHRNHVVEFRSDVVRRAVRALRRSPAYPAVRRVVGADRVRRLRGRLTRRPALPSTEELVAGCGPDQRARLARLRSAADAAVAPRLAEQDARLGTGWATSWQLPERPG